MSIFNEKYHIPEISNSKKKLELLTGFRGFLAITVLLHHASYDLHLKNDYNTFKGLGYFVGVIGFFFLSSFLLTYRLILDLEEKTAIKDIFKVIAAYLIRRLCRVYFPFVVFCTLLKWKQKLFGGYFVRYSSFMSLITLQNVGHNHLWTIASEIKYYFFIPVLSLIYIKFGKNKKYLIYGLSLYIFIIEYFNIYKLKNSDHSPAQRHLLLPRFNVFLSASIIAMVYLNSNLKYEFSKSKIFVLSFKIFVTSLIIYFPYKFLKYLNPKVLHITHSTLSGIYLSIIVLLLLIGPQDYFITKWLRKSSFLLKCGKFSFGIYLFHPMVMKINKLIKTKTDFEMIVIITFISLLIGLVFYYMVEKNFIKLGDIVIKYFNKY